jgi:hypothetical protein
MQTLHLSLPNANTILRKFISLQIWMKGHRKINMTTRAILHISKGNMTIWKQLVPTHPPQLFLLTSALSLSLNCSLVHATARWVIASPIFDTLKAKQDAYIWLPHQQFIFSICHRHNLQSKESRFSQCASLAKQHKESQSTNPGIIAEKERENWCIICADQSSKQCEVQKRNAWEITSTLRSERTQCAYNTMNTSFAW